MFGKAFGIWRLALLIKIWILFHHLVLLWCWENSWKFSHYFLFFFGVASSVNSASSLPALLGCRFSEVNWCSVILWRWDFCGEFCDGAFFFFGIENPVPEITTVPCTSLVLGCSAIDSTRSVYSPATSWQGWKMKIWATRKAAVKWKNTLLKSSYWLCSPMVVSLLQYN